MQGRFRLKQGSVSIPDTAAHCCLAAGAVILSGRYPPLLWCFIGYSPLSLSDEYTMIATGFGYYIKKRRVRRRFIIKTSRLQQFSRL
jgi:hypothetical protein